MIVTSSTHSLPDVFVITLFVKIKNVWTLAEKMEYDIDRRKRASRGQDIKGIQSVLKRSGSKSIRGKLCMDLPGYYWRNEYNNLLCK